MRCANCLQVIDDSVLTAGPDGEQYCPDCLQELFETCSGCEEFISKLDMVAASDGLYCQECFDEKFALCAACEDVFEIEDTHLHLGTDDAPYCASCFDERFTTCGSCRGTYRNSDIRYSEVFALEYCDSCWADRLTYCSSCGCEAVIDDCHFNSNGCYCDSCREENDDDSIIHGNEYKPKPVFYHEKEKTDLYFGIELEIENDGGQDNVEVAKSLPDYCYAKEDGSLNDGFEVVTHPLSWAWIMKNKNGIADLLNKLNKKGYRSYNTGTCGLHIHISRKAFGSFHLYKFLSFVYDNPNFIVEVSRRKTENLKQWASVWDEESIVAKVKKNGNYLRYTAVNLQRHNTVEVRIFRGTLAASGFFRALEFCKAVFEFTRETAKQNITESNFRAYVANRKDYPNLNKFLVRKCV